MSTLEIDQDPFPHLVADDVFPAADIAAAAESWPDPDWPGWVAYNPKYESKRASDLEHVLPYPCALLLARLAALPVADYFGEPDAVPDLSLHGAGLHEMRAGRLGVHLDADRHARLGLERRLSAVLWVHPRWESAWGGELCLWNEPHSEVARRIEPRPGRLAVFEASTPWAWHSVAAVRCPPGQRRMALALFWWGPAPPAPGRRPRAEFAGVSDR